MKVTFIVAIVNLVLLTPCFGQVSLNSRDQYHDNAIPVDNKNVPTDSIQFYFPLQFFPESELVDNYEDSSTVLVYSFTSNKGDTTKEYSKLVPNEFDTSLVRRYSRYLFALKEPLLFNKPTNKEVFRFTWLRTFDNPIVIRIEKNFDDYILCWKVSTGAGGYYPGILKTDKKKKLSKENWNEFQSRLRTIDYWKSKNIGNFFGTDGSRWILEGSTPDMYQVVDEWSPGKDGDFYRACDYLIDLTGLKIKESKKY